jgi:hypothetical protein
MPLETDGFPPDATPRFGHILAERWHEEALADDSWELSGGGARFRHSMAGDCARAIAYAALKVPKSNPMDLASHFITKQGTLIHGEWQRLFAERFGGDVEVTVHFDGTTGHADGVATVPPEQPELGQYLAEHTVVAIEGKSVDGYSYKEAMGIPPAAHVPMGPKHSHKLQAFLNARALGADEAVIIYWTRGAISVQAANRYDVSEMNRVTAEWTYPREVYEPIADAEIQRVMGILRLLDDESMLPKRRIPDPELPLHHVITNPRKGEWVEYDKDGRPVNAGSFWKCHYCAWQDTCASTGPQRESVEVLAFTQGEGNDA